MESLTPLTLVVFLFLAALYESWSIPFAVILAVPLGIFGALTGVRTVHLDIIDYPGEWLLDLALMDKTYADWAEETLTRIAARPAVAY